MLCSGNLELACCLTLIKLGAPLMSLSPITPTSIPEYEPLVPTSAKTPNNTSARGGVSVRMKGAASHQAIVAVHMSEGRAARMPDRQAYRAHSTVAMHDLSLCMWRYITWSKARK